MWHDKSAEKSHAGEEKMVCGMTRLPRRVWRVARTGDEIWKNMYRIENPKDQKDLIGYWKFNDGEGNVVKDYSWVGNHGKAVGDIIWPDGIEIHEINKEEE